MPGKGRATALRRCMLHQMCVAGQQTDSMPS